MKRAPVYSQRATPAKAATGRGATPMPGRGPAADTPDAFDAVDEEADVPAGPPLRKRLGAFYKRREPLVLFVASLLIAGGTLLWWQSRQAPQREYSQEDIDAAVLHTVETKTLPSRAAKAAELIRHSVVRVNGFEDDPARNVKDADKDARDRSTDPRLKPESPAQQDAKAGKDGKEARGGAGGSPQGQAPAGKGRDSRDSSAAKDGKARDGKLPQDPEGPMARNGKGAPADKGKDGKDGKDNDRQARKSDVPAHPEDEKRQGRVGSGVVIVDTGIILTNLHVVAGAKRLTVTFYDGMESEAEVIAAQPENDLAVIKVKKMPDDLPAATLGSSARLMPGDDVVAVGFPFGIGPSVSAGVVSGLNRGFKSGDGKRQLTRLIQFDAAVNPGNSGGPLITMDGEVVGIVTAIFNPTEQRTFIGIGFAATIESAGAAVGIPPF